MIQATRIFKSRIWVDLLFLSAMQQGLNLEERMEIMDQTSVELAQASVKDWSFIAVTRC